MRTITTLATLSLVALLSACGMPNDGYYDANGNYVPPPNATTDAQRFRAPDPGRSYRHDHDRDRAGYYEERPVVVVPPGAPAYIYDRAGYYDYNGYYVTFDDRMEVPQGMFPPRGMCRIWLPGRVPSKQPAIETCNNIQARVPAGAYVIYGG